MKVKFKKGTVSSLILLVILLIAVLVSGKLSGPAYSASVQDVPDFGSDAYVIINDNKPEFSEEDYTTRSYEYYSELDLLGRCGYVMACIGTDIMPTEERGEIGQVKPTGWQTVKYDSVDGKYLYNRCHLIGYQLTGENANERNLITGTRYMNTEGMLPFENLVAEYVQDTGNHVLYRVTPVFDGNNLVARGVQMEAMSMEDHGVGVCFNVYVYNNQPGISIDYANGTSWLEGETVSTTTDSNVASYILNTNSQKFHGKTCSQAQDIKAENRQIYEGDREDLIRQGYTACKGCNP